MTETMYRTVAISPEDLRRAVTWRERHKAHVEALLASPDSEGFTYAPSGSDKHHPELWRPPHWRWLKEVLLAKPR